ncbi:tripartite motif-containing protein 16-like [Lethenteron reissneri]|uniref:tripartite motif-containing protein 16-like n=1 Tax=Lethenteron reissneri TaxID=7753 RepID=UPI002AB6653B|nr:tripartite motif-containing protein 16-like [Lethenteron reissneri]
MEGAVPCDYCLGGSAAAAAAVKTCLTCLTSFCEEHLRPHKENALLRTHQLIEATRNVAEKLCPTHARVLDFFCEREQRPLCHECSLGSEHRTHRHTALEETCRAKRVSGCSTDSETLDEKTLTDSDMLTDSDIGSPYAHRL